MALKVEYIGIDLIKPYANNAKVHDGNQIEQIKESIKKFGFNDPVAVWKDNEIIEGHGRYIAARELGISELPIIRLDKLSDEQRRAYALVHNKLTTDTGFDIDILQEELDVIKSYDMSGFGFVPLQEINYDKYYEEKQEKRIKVKCKCCGEIFYVVDGEVVK